MFVYTCPIYIMYTVKCANSTNMEVRYRKCGINRWRDKGIHYPSQASRPNKSQYSRYQMFADHEALTAKQKMALHGHVYKICNL